MLQRVRTGIRDARSTDEGFTLIELLIVIVVLGVLSGITVFGVATFKGDSETAACKADVKTVNVASDAYNAKTGLIPTSVNKVGTETTSLEGGGYIKGTTAGTWAYNATSKSWDRTPAC